MTRVVYRGNTSFEDVPDGTLLTVGRQQAVIPRHLASSRELREAAFDLVEARDEQATALTPALRVLDRMGALARTEGGHAHLPGWGYALRHAQDPDAAMRALSSWSISREAHASGLPEADREVLRASLGMFGTWTHGRRVVGVLLGPGSRGPADLPPGDLHLFVDPRVGADRPATVWVARDARRARELWALRHAARHPAADVREVGPGTPLRRLLLVLGAALVVDEVSGMRRLRNAYAVGDDLSVANVDVPDRAPLQVGAPPSAETPPDGLVVDRLIRHAAVDARMAGRLDVAMTDAGPSAACEWWFAGRRRRVSATGTSAGAAGAEAVARAVAVSLRIRGARGLRVSVGSATVEHGDTTSLVPVDSVALLGTADVRIALLPDAVDEGARH